MDNDLISRNKTVQLLRAYADEVGCERGEYELANGILKAACFLSDSENVPTAHDVDKIVERLEDHFNNSDDKSARLAYHHSIGIVKSGGIE